MTMLRHLEGSKQVCSYYLVKRKRLEAQQRSGMKGRRVTDLSRDRGGINEQGCGLDFDSQLN